MKGLSKFYTIGAVGILALAASCGKINNDNYELSDIHNATTADSMMYYSGQIRAAEFWDDALEDDSLAMPASREEFLKGVSDGIKSFEKGEVYNRGFRIGRLISDNCKRLSVRYGMEFRSDIVFKSLRAGLRDDTIINIVESRNRFNDMINVCEKIHSDKILSSAVKTLQREAKSLNMKQISEYIYGHTELEGTGELLEVGDKVRTIINIETLDGEKIPYKTMEKLSVGDRYMNKAFTEALLTMSPGEVKKFAIPAVIVIGENCMEYDLRPSETLIVTMKVFTEDK